MSVTGVGALQALHVKVNGAGLAREWEDRLYYVSVDRQLCVTGRAVLRFRDDGFVLSSQDLFKIGNPVTVVGADGVEVFEGTVTAYAVEQRSSAGPEVHVTVDDAAHKLAMFTHTKAFLSTTYENVIKELCTLAKVDLKAVAGDGITYEYLLQSGSALDYLDEVAARTGRVWWVEGSTLHLAPPKSDGTAVTLTLGQNLSSLSVRASGQRPGSVAVSSWDAANLADVEVKAANATGLPDRPGFHGKALPTAPVTVRDARAMTTAEAKAVGQAMRTQAESESVVAQGEGDFNSAISPGRPIQIAKAGAANERYLVTAVEHLWEPGHGLRTWFKAGSLRPEGLTDLLGRRESAGFTIGGVLPAVVTNVQDPQSKGRVKVKYATQGDQVESPWARLVTVGAGAKRGFEFSPEVGDEVLVAFEEGDTRRPVILGGLFSDKNAFAGASKSGNLEGDKVGYRRITSRLGHTMEFADGSGAATQHILMELAGGAHRIRLGADKLDVVTDKLPISLTTGAATVTLAANGDITLEGNNVTIKAKAAIKLEAKGEVAVKGAQVGIDAQAMLKLKASGPATVEAGGPLAVKGATVAIN